MDSAILLNVLPHLDIKTLAALRATCWALVKPVENESKRLKLYVKLIPSLCVPLVPCWFRGSATLCGIDDHSGKRS